VGDSVALEGIQSCSQTLIGCDAVAVIARVVPDVTGVDKVFDYLVVDGMVHEIQVGDRVRIPLHRRNVAGWVVAIGDTSSQFSEVDKNRLLPVIKVLGRGPSHEIVQLAQWACHMWAGRLRAFFVASSPSTIVATLPGSRYTAPNSRKKFDVDIQVAESVRLKQTSVLRRGPASGPRVLVLSAAQAGPTLVVIPTINRARLMAASLREHGLSVAVMPQDWAIAAGGVDVVIGARSAIWASVPSLHSIIVIDEHDDALQEERSPSWHARDVAVRRAEQLGIACLLVSPVPSLRTLHHTSGVVLSVGDEIENSQWPEIRIIDRRLDERWASSLLSSELIEQLRDHTRRIVCVLNVKGRAKLLACGNCRDLVRCDTCDAAMSMFGIGELLCPRCAHKRPAVCMGCGSGKLAVIKAGVSRLREELAAAAGWRVEDVVEVVASSSGKTDVEIDQTKMLFVGTEAALHRVRDVDTVIFLDIDQEISAPRYRASEISLTLVIHAARLVARSGSQGLVLVQTFLADHALLRGLSSHDLSEFISGEMSRRKLLSLPPFGALAQLSGNGIDAVADDLRSNILLQVSATAHESVLVKAQSWDELADGLAASITTTTSKSARIKTQVDPPRA
jgi:primosomal protein N' (replication factor Y) (superfamily II helicase)